MLPPLRRAQDKLLGAVFHTWIGFWSVVKWMISNACLMMRTAMAFLPLLRPGTVDRGR